MARVWFTAAARARCGDGGYANDRLRRRGSPQHRRLVYRRDSPRQYSLSRAWLSYSDRGRW